MNYIYPNLKVTDIEFKELFNYIPSPIYVWKKIGSELLLIYYNKATENITNFNIKQSLGEKAKIIYKNKPQIIKDLYRCINKKLNFSREMSDKLISVDKEKYFHVTYNYIPPDLIFVHTEDITKQKKAEDFLKKSENEKTYILNGISELIVFQDAKNNIIWANKAAGDSVGIPQEELIGQKCFEVWHNREIPCEICPVNRAVKTGQSEVDHIISPDKREWIIKGFPIRDDNINLLGIVEVAENISGQKTTERKLKESEGKYRELFNNMGSCVAVYEAIDNGNDFLFKDFNLAAKKVNKIKREDTVGKSIVNIFPGVNDCGLFEIIQRVWKTGIPEHHPISYYRDERIHGWRENYVYKLPTGEVVDVYEDVTKNKLAINQRKISEEKYRREYSRTNLYKDIFTHDINNILQNILSSIELSKIFSSSPNKKKEFEEVTNLIYEEVIRGKNLVSNVQKMADVEKLKISISSIESFDILKQTIVLLKQNYPHKKIIIGIEASQDEYYVFANELLKNVFENIFFNCVTHNRNSNIEILVEISNEKKDGVDYIKYEFTDNGMGIPDSMKKNIFVREYNENEIPSGIGLGLLIINRILESYKGEIKVEDRIKGDYSRGSNFIVIIPKAVKNGIFF